MVPPPSTDESSHSDDDVTKWAENLLDFDYAVQFQQMFEGRFLDQLWNYFVQLLVLLNKEMTNILWKNKECVKMPSNYTKHHLWMSLKQWISIVQFKMNPGFSFSSFMSNWTSWNSSDFYYSFSYEQQVSAELVSFPFLWVISLGFLQKLIFWDHTWRFWWRQKKQHYFKFTFTMSKSFFVLNLYCFWRFLLGMSQSDHMIGNRSRSRGWWLDWDRMLYHCLSSDST